LEEFPDEDIIATSIEIKTENSGFAKRVEVFGSYDNVNWEKSRKTSCTAWKESKNLKYNLTA